VWEFAASFTSQQGAIPVLCVVVDLQCIKREPSGRQCVSLTLRDVMEESVHDMTPVTARYVVPTSESMPTYVAPNLLMRPSKDRL
jgi:hypothetical protein